MTHAQITAFRVARALASPVASLPGGFPGAVANVPNAVASFAGAARAAKGKASGKKAKGKGSARVRAGGPCGANSPGGGGFQKGNTCGGGQASAQRAAANRVKARLAVKAQGAQANAAARAASVRVEATRKGAGPAAAIVARSAKGAAMAARVKAAQDKAALEKRQARNAKTRAKRAEKKAAAKQAEAKPARDRAIGAMVARSRAAAGKGAEVQAGRVKAHEAGVAQAAKIKAQQAAKAAKPTFYEAPARTYNGIKSLTIANVTPGAGGAVLHIQQEQWGNKRFKVSTVDPLGGTHLGTFEGLKAAKSFAREQLARTPSKAALSAHVRAEAAAVEAKAQAHEEAARLAAREPANRRARILAKAHQQVKDYRGDNAAKVKRARQVIAKVDTAQQARLAEQRARAERRRARQPRLDLARGDRAQAIHRMVGRSKAAASAASASPKAPTSAHNVAARLAAARAAQSAQVRASAATKPAQAHAVAPARPAAAVARPPASSRMTPAERDARWRAAGIQVHRVGGRAIASKDVERHVAASTVASAPAAKPSLRQMADAARAAKGSLSEREYSVYKKASRAYNLAEIAKQDAGKKLDKVTAGAKSTPRQVANAEKAYAAAQRDSLRAQAKMVKIRRMGEARRGPGKVSSAYQDKLAAVTAARAQRRAP